MQVSETVLHKAAHDGVVLQNADTIFMYSQPNTNTRVRRGRDGLKQREQRVRLVMMCRKTAALTLSDTVDTVVGNNAKKPISRFCPLRFSFLFFSLKHTDSLFSLNVGLHSCYFFVICNIYSVSEVIR